MRTGICKLTSQINLTENEVREIIVGIKAEKGVA